MLRLDKCKIISIFMILSVLCVPLRSRAEDQPEVLKMATTTSTENTGLLDYLSLKFKEATGIELQCIAVGTGKAIKLGENCDVDVLMVHAPEMEMKFVQNGFGVDRREVMYNDFVIIGPESDPAEISGLSVSDSLVRIKQKQSRFVSRGDQSGTHTREQSLWRSAGLQVPDKEKWYIQAGQGMLATINMAAEQTAYTLTDRGTYIRYEVDKAGKPPLKILVQGDKHLVNQYSVIAVNPKHCTDAKYDLATQFIQWITAKETQQAIADFKLLGKPLFTPNAKIIVPKVTKVR